MRLVLTPLIFCACAASALALVNPSLQPYDLNERHNAVVAARVTENDEEKQVVTLEVLEVLAGSFVPRQVTLSYPSVKKGAEEGTPAVLAPGRKIVAWAGKKRGSRGAGELLIYAGDREWFLGEMEDPAKGDRWIWKSAAEEKMVGTFNGSSERLIQMLREGKEGRLFFPSVVFAQFQPDQVIAQFEEPLAGVALYDLDQDGRLDALACTPAGVKVYRQAGPGKFEDATEALGLAQVPGKSLGIADVQGDGRPDLLIDGVIFLNQAGKFSRADLLPVVSAPDLKVATFADFNADGFPDVLISRNGGGLSLHLNPGAEGGAFIDATDKSGLREAAPQGNGFVSLGDWNLDGRLDLFYATGRGQLLVQDAEGKFTVLKQNLMLDFRGGSRFEPGLSGAGMFAPIWENDAMGFVLPMDSAMAILRNDDGAPENVTRYGNEIALGTLAQRATLAEDLDMDGYVDLLTISRDPKAGNSYHTNRGYGSFMHAQIYKASFWPGESYQKGAGGVAAGDVDGDGANDILLGGLDGRLVLVLSDALSLRKPSEYPVHHLAVLQQTGILSVHVEGDKGVAGAMVRLLDDKDHVVALRSIGLSALTGCRNPDAANIAVRNPGPHRLVVRYSDGHEEVRNVEVARAAHTVVRVKR